MRSAAPASTPEAAVDARAAAPAPALADAAGTMLSVPPLGPGDAGSCANPQDPALRALLEEVLPEMVGATEAAVRMECRPGGGRGVHLEVRGGLFSVGYLPPGGAARLVDPASVNSTEPTASGGTVTVTSRAGQPGSPAPFADRVDEVAAYLARRL